MKNQAKKIIIIGFAICVFVIVSLGIGACIWYQIGKKPVQKENGQVIRIEIQEKTGTVAIAQLLEQNQVIKNANVMKIYAKLNHITSLKEGKYDLNL